MRRLGRSMAISSMLALAAASPVLAAEPAEQGCLGTDFSTYARYGAPGPVLSFGPGSGFGQFNAALAQQVPGLGLPIQIHLAGFIPDGYVINSCND